MSYVLTFDIELTGPNFVANSMVNIGAIFTNPDGVEEDKLDLIINMIPGTDWDQQTLDSFWLKKENTTIKELYNKIKNGQGLPYQAAMEKLEEFLIRCARKSICAPQQSYAPEWCSLTILSDRAYIDIAWINYYMNLCGKKGILEYLNSLIVAPRGFGKSVRVLDGNSYAQGLAVKTANEITSFEQKNSKFWNAEESMLIHWNVNTRSQTPHTHCALDDAKRTSDHHNFITATINRKNNKVPIKQIHLN